MKKNNKYLKKTLWVILIFFIFLNIIAYFHAYKFTHFADDSIKKTEKPENLSFLEKGSTLLFGINNPRPKNDKTPEQEYETIKLSSNKELECWSIKRENAKGTIIIFHGFSGQKSSMLDKSNEFLKLGFNTFLVDFMGSGGSEGNQTTIGYHEAEQVLTCFNYLKTQGEKNIYLFGTSMGSVAIMKAINDFEISPKAIIIECPFGSLYKTICVRFETMNIPCFPMAGLLTFWGGIQNGFWAFEHHPINYAKKIKCPTLLIYGNQDERVTKNEIDDIYTNLKGKKRLKIYPHAGHENYLINYRKEWVSDIQIFLNSI